MNAASFRFTLLLPGDARLVGAVRDLTAHAAGYAGLSPGDVDALTRGVVEATEAAIAATQAAATPIQLAFTRDGSGLHVTITAEATDGTTTSRVVESA